jgi:hypothetical protein
MSLLSIVIIFGLIGAVVLAIEIGYRIGLRWFAAIPEAARRVAPTIEGSIFGLMALLIAFTFSGAASRFDIRRNLIVEEANIIGTAYLRLDLLPAEAQPGLRDGFRKYVRSRIAVFQNIRDVQALRRQLSRSEAIQNVLWKEVLEGTRTSGAATQSLMLTSMNQLIDITTTRTVALTTHPPVAIYAMLGLAVFVSSALAGYAMSLSGSRDWMQIIIFAVVLGVAIYVILDYEYPRVGLVRVDPVDQVLVEELNKMK